MTPAFEELPVPQDLDELTDLGVLHYRVLELLSEAIDSLHRSGYTKREIHLALADDAVLRRAVSRR